MGDGTRVLYTEHRPAWDAKNRYGLPFELGFPEDGAWDLFERACRAGAPADIDSLNADLDELVARADEKLVAQVTESRARCGGEARKLEALIKWTKAKLAEADKKTTEAA